MNIEIINYVYCTEYYIGNYNSMYNVHISIYLDFFCKIKEDLRKKFNNSESIRSNFDSYSIHQH